MTPDKPIRPSTRITIGKSGLTRHKLANLAAVRRRHANAAREKKDKAAPVELPVRQKPPVRKEWADARPDRIRYLAELTKRRLELSDSSGKDAARDQQAIYRLLGLDLAAGFEGRPPSFRADSVQIGGSRLYSRIRNVSMDPLATMRRRKEITEIQHDAALLFVDACEAFSSVGIRNSGFSEAVDGGRRVDVPLAAIQAANAFRFACSAMSPDSLVLISLIAIHGWTLTEIATLRRFGGKRQTVGKRLRVVLDRLAEHFGLVRALPNAPNDSNS